MKGLCDTIVKDQNFSDEQVKNQNFLGRKNFVFPLIVRK